MKIPPISQKELEYNAFKERVYMEEAELLYRQEMLDFYSQKTQEIEREVNLEIEERDRVAALIMSEKNKNFIDESDYELRK